MTCHIKSGHNEQGMKQKSLFYHFLSVFSNGIAMPEETAIQKVVDVVDDFSCPYQTSDYQEAFRSWRRRKQNPYAFRFTVNPKETAFSESHAIVRQSPAQVEQNVLNRMGRLIGCAMMIYLVVENLFDKVIVWAMQFLHLHIELVFLGENKLYGDEQLVFWLEFIVHILKYFIPALVVQSVMKLPVQVSMPLKMRKPQKLLSGISLIMLLSTGMGMLSVPRSADLEKYRTIFGMIGAEDHKMMIYLLMVIFISPLVMELFLHGCMFQALRQFGDLFAMISTAVLAGALTHNFFDGVRIGLIHLAISYYFIHTGSFWSVVCLRIIHEIYMFVLFYIDSVDNDGSIKWWVILGITCIFCFATGIYIFLHKNSASTAIQNRTYLTLQEKLEAFFTAMPMVSFLVCSVLLLVIEVMLF